MSFPRNFAAGWRAFWFQPEPPQALEVCRILLYAGLLAIFADRDFTICSVLGEIYWRPTSFAHLLFPHGPPPAAIVSWMQLIWKLSLFTSCLGLASRISTTVACFLGLILLELPNNFGKLDHQMAAAGVSLIVMAFSACGRTLSLDSVIARRRGKPFPSLSPDETGWPIRTMRVVISMVFFCAACNKLRASGLAWVFSETMQMYLLQRKMGGIVTWLVRYPALCSAMAGFAPDGGVLSSSFSRFQALRPTLRPPRHRHVHRHLFYLGHQFFLPRLSSLFLDSLGSDLSGLAFDSDEKSWLISSRPRMLSFSGSPWPDGLSFLF